MTDADAYAAPTPKIFYIHDDLSEYIRERQGEASAAWQLTHELFALVLRDPSHVVVLTLEWQMTRLLAQGTYSPFALTIGIGRAGERVAQQLHTRTGWFPKIVRVGVTREEDGHGGYNIVTTTDVPLAQQLPMLDTIPSLATKCKGLHTGLLPARRRGLAGEYRAVMSYRERLYRARKVARRGKLHQCQRPGDAHRHSPSKSAAASLFRTTHVDAGVVSRPCR